MGKHATGGWLRVWLPLALAGLCGGCQHVSPPERYELPAPLHLVRGGLSADGRQLLAMGTAKGHCFAADLYDLSAAPRLASTTAGPSSERAACGVRTAAAAADGRTLAVYDNDAGRVDVMRLAANRSAEQTSLALPGEAGFPHPPPGRNLALSPDGTALLVGAVERDCHKAAAGTRCGTAFLYRRAATGWKLAHTLARPDGVGDTAHFGQSVVLLPDGGVIVGGTGLTGGPGALHFFQRQGAAFVLRQTLLPQGRNPEFFATDLAASGDGSWLAVGGAQHVALYRREGPGWTPAGRLDPPEDRAGHFGEAVALNGDGSVLIAGAPRAPCAAGSRCGIAYRYVRDGSGWHLAGPLRALHEREENNLGHTAALDAAGRGAALEGAGIYIERYPLR